MIINYSNDYIRNTNERCVVFTRSGRKHAEMARGCVGATLRLCGCVVSVCVRGSARWNKICPVNELAVGAIKIAILAEIRTENRIFNLIIELKILFVTAFRCSAWSKFKFIWIWFPKFVIWRPGKRKDYSCATNFNMQRAALVSAAATAVRSLFVLLHPSLNPNFDQPLKMEMPVKHNRAMPF